jgi:hypothetical protein
LEILPSLGRKCKLRRSTTAIGSAEEIWTVEVSTSREQWRSAQEEERSEPSDLTQNTRQPLDLSGVA